MDRYRVGRVLDCSTTEIVIRKKKKEKWRYIFFLFISKRQCNSFCFVFLNQVEFVVVYTTRARRDVSKLYTCRLHTSELAPRLFLCLSFFLLENTARGLNMRATAAAARPEKNERGGRLRRVGSRPSVLFVFSQPTLISFYLKKKFFESCRFWFFLFGEDGRM